MFERKRWQQLCAAVLGAIFMAGGTGAVAQCAEGAGEAASIKQPADERKIVINLAARSLALFEKDKKIRLYPIGPGKESTPTPVGYYSIRSKDINPTWIDPSDPEFSIPSGAANPLGYRWMEIKGNYGIHGTNKPESIGHYVSNGCIRMMEQDVEALFDMVEIGTPVEITYNRIVVEKDNDGTVVYYIYPDGYERQDITVDEVSNWLAGYGVEDFEPNAAIEKKIKASDGQPTFIAKAYPLTVNGQKVKGKAIVKDDITYLPAADIAQALKISLGWKPSEEILVSSLGEAVGIEKKDTLYCNADDVASLFKVDGGINKQGIYALKSLSQAVVPLVKDGTPVDPNAPVEEQAKQAELNAQREAARELEKAEARETAKEAARKKAEDKKSVSVTRTEKIVVRR